MQPSKTQLADMLKALPPKVRDAMFSDETANILKEVGEKRKLHVDQVGLIAEAVGDVMLGLIPRATFASVVARRANLEKAVADDIASEVATKIFTPIQEHLREATSGGADVVTLPPPSFEVKKSYVAASPSVAPASPPPTIPPTPPQTSAPSEPGASTPRMATPTLRSDASPFLPVPETPATPPTPPSTPPPTPTTPEQKPPAPNIVGAKLGGVTYGVPSTEAKPTAPPSPAIDPYREPIE